VSNLPTRYKRGEIARRVSGGLYLETEGKKAGGVCAGLAVWTGTPALVWRLAFIVGTITVGVGLPLYVALWLLMDKRPPPTPRGPEDMTPEEREIWEATMAEVSAMELEND
jgi:phage shock protein PspC (stress-responsive transcriptional regulator)